MISISGRTKEDQGRGRIVKIFRIVKENNFFAMQPLLPHVMHSVEELSVVRDLANWSNHNVQFIGKLFLGIDGVYMCEGIEKNSSAKIGVDFTLTAQIPPRNVVVRIWGEIELQHNLTAAIPIVKAKVCNFFSSKTYFNK